MPPRRRFRPILDRFVLRPSIHPLTPEGRTRRVIPFDGGELEVWTHRHGPPGVEPQLAVLKFVGNASRAEWAGAHPADAWPDLTAEVWAVNMPGYGGSTGPAMLSKFGPAALAAREAIGRAVPRRPVVVTGNSLGTTAALYLAARGLASALVLRNPPPLRELILGRFGWWNLWLGAWIVARRTPTELDSVGNAQKSRAPAVFIRSMADEIVPPEFQARIYDAYAGPKRLLELEGAGHATMMTDEQEARYTPLLAWLRETMGLAGPAITRAPAMPAEPDNPS